MQKDKHVFVANKREALPIAANKRYYRILEENQEKRRSSKLLKN